MAFLPVQWQAVVDRTRTVRASLSGGQQASLLAVFVGVTALVIGATWYLNQAEYRVLFSDLNAEEAAQIVDRLAADNVDYQLRDDGRTVLVPVGTTDRLKLQFAGEGMPTSGRIGFEIFDKVAFGQTEFLEHVNYKRAIEGELARTIATLSEVRSARVHIAMEKASLFGAREQPAKASITLTLKGSKPLPPASGVAITNLVAASVEGLRADQVVIIDSLGRELSRGSADNDGPLSGAELEKQQKYERDMAMKVVRLLEPVAGVDRVRANVTVRLHGASEEQTVENFDPNTVLRSEQTTSEGSDAQATAAGVAGARGNLPAAVQANGQPDPATAPPTTNTSTNGFTKTSKVSNYEVSKTTTHTIRPRGEIAQVSVAVILDDEHVASTAADGSTTTRRKPRDGAAMQKLQKLVAASLGIDPKRGDQVTVENMAFEAPVAEPVVAPAWWQKVGEQSGTVVRPLAVLGIVALFLLVVVRPVLGRTLRVAGSSGPGPDVRVGMPQQLPRTIEEIEQEIEQQLDHVPAEGDRRQPVLTRRVSRLAEKEPESAAKLVRGWLNDGKVARS